MSRNYSLPFIEALIIGISLCFTTCASATVLVSESFDYATGDLNGKNGGVGFNGAWDASSEFSVASGSLNVPNYAGAGNLMKFSSEELSSLSAGRNLGDTYSAGGSDIWASILFRVESLTAYAGITFTSDDQSSPGLFVGIPDGPEGAGPPADNWGMDTAGGTDRVSTSIPVAYGQTTLLVIHISELSGEDRIDLYVNPPEVLPATPDATKTMSDWSFNRISCDIDYGLGAFDEIRIGTTYADVRPAPKPTPRVPVAACEKVKQDTCPIVEAKKCRCPRLFANRCAYRHRRNY